MGVRFKTSYACDSEADLPSILNRARDGETAYCLAEGTTWRKVTGAWQEWTGEVGPQGPPGEDGSDGAPGNTYLAVPFLSGTVTLTNMALADTELPATHYRLKLDLTGFTQFRVTARVATQGSANSDIRFQGSTDDSSFGSLDGSNGPELALFGVGEKDTGWQPLAVAYRAANIRIRMMGKDGDGAADPVVRQVVLHFK